MIKHSGLDESGDSNASDDVDLPISANSHLDISRLPKGRLTFPTATLTLKENFYDDTIQT